MNLRCTAATMLMITSGVFASPFDIEVDTLQSEITMEMCMTIPVWGERCDGDTSPVDGWAAMSLDCLTDPNAVSLHDFDLWLTEDVEFHLYWGIIPGRFDGTGSDIEVLYAGLEPLPPVPIGSGGTFTYTDVPVEAAGQFEYTTTASVCIALRAIGWPCDGTIDLSEMDFGPMDVDGTIEVDGRYVTGTLDVDLYSALHPDFPDVGGMSVAGTVVGHGTVPLPDVPTFIGVLLGDITDLDVVCESDVNADGTVNGLDIQPYVDGVLGS